MGRGSATDLDIAAEPRALAAVSDLVSMPRSGQAAEEMRVAFDCVRAVHQLPADVGRLAIKTGRGRRVASRYQLREQGLVLSELLIERDADGKALAALRSIAELIDSQTFYQAGRSAARAGAAELQPWRQAVEASRSYQQLRTIAEVSEFHAAEAELDAVFQRAYEQWIVSESGSPDLRAAFAAQRDAQTELYWGDREFRPIAAALRALITAMGWTSNQLAA